MDRNLALELVRVTEAAALSASRWMGKGDAAGAANAAASAMHRTLELVPLSGHILLSESSSDTPNLLQNGESIGDSSDVSNDLVLDPLECTRSVAFGRSNAMSVIAMAPEGDFVCPPTRYMDKLAVGPDAASVVDLRLSVEDNLKRIAQAKSYAVRDLTVAVLDRERHTGLIEKIRKSGARLHSIPDGDVAAAIATTVPGSGVDVLMGIGGSTAGVLAAAAIRCLGGELLCRLAPFDDNERRQFSLTEQQINRIYRASDLVRGSDAVFAATGVTDGDVLNGVRPRRDGAVTHSLVMRLKSRTRRYIVSEHFFDDEPVY